MPLTDAATRVATKIMGRTAPSPPLPPVDPPSVLRTSLASDELGGCESLLPVAATRAFEFRRVDRVLLRCFFEDLLVGAVSVAIASARAAACLPSVPAFAILDATLELAETSPLLFVPGLTADAGLPPLEVGMTSVYCDPALLPPVPWLFPPARAALGAAKATSATNNAILRTIEYIYVEEPGSLTKSRLKILWSEVRHWRAFPVRLSGGRSS